MADSPDVSEKLPLPTRVPPWFREPTLWQRFLGSVIDGLLTGLGGLAAYTVGVLAFGADVDSWDSTASSLTIAVLVFAYNVGLVATTGQTVGKMAMRTRVVSLDAGEIVSPGAAAIRWIVSSTLPTLVGLVAEPLAGLGLLYTIVVFWPILRPPLHRGLHDQAAGTIVTAV